MCPSCLSVRFAVKAILGLIFCIPAFLLLLLGVCLSVFIGLPVYFALKGAGCVFGMDPIDYTTEQASRFYNFWRTL